MIWRSVKGRFKNRMNPLPLFIITTAVGGFDDGEVVAKARRDPEANKIMMDHRII